MKNLHIDNNNEFDFGRTSNNYAKYRDIYPASMYEKLVSFGIGREGQHILDLGSGTAVLPINLHHTGAHFTATDISENQIAYGQHLAAEQDCRNIRFKVCSAEDTGFADNSFDAITAVQCFPYFDADKAAWEIYRILKPQGLFGKIFMDWLPYEDKVLGEMERLVLKYNPAWSGSGFHEYNYQFPAWAENRFTIQNVCSYNEVLKFNKEAWLGRVKTCRGIGAALPPKKIAEFEAEYCGLLQKYNEPLQLKHQIHIEVYRSVK